MVMERLLAEFTISWKEYFVGMLKPLPALIILAAAVVISYVQKLGLEKDMIYSVTRSFIQLSVVAFLLDFIFKQKNVAWILLAFIFMVILAAHTAGTRAKHVPYGAFVAGVSIFVGTSITMVILICVRAFPFTPHYIIPIMGMMVGNSMTITGVTLKRLRDDLRLQKDMVETALALGATPRQATLTQVKRALTVALSPALDNAKVVGLISLPGAMTGLIMGGASPFEAIQLQIMVMNMLLGASTFSSILSTYLVCSFLFTKTYQIKEKVIRVE
ncbi:hypothetical protein O6H91_15G085000 [Diphasiastrum complanatum]|uniref:Uncharacterized protein n=3 Tax=Diphasiastrum complanatum TaxID=34168 RepID=A0ACC2BKF1_DIPCM|nr:hypothetical protein O6H91_15G085000 [Diphasiastrum complanatum]KAJ7530205.1 hypothetical protein O6H91_15G085000 [Diphasiastrum complanatum]KAJ7530207.1 hypothetical protein O6H91_15G085000 [Diphasiastrum complanatum]